MQIKALLIEDEIIAGEHLLKLIAQNDFHIEVIEVLRTVEQAILWFEKNELPDLIFMDIQLSDGISFDILEKINIDCPIIFTTAYDEYAIQAFKTTGIDYLLKPITSDELTQAIQKFNQFTVTQNEAIIKNIELLQMLKKEEILYKDRFLLKSGKTIFPVKTSDIAYFYRDELVFAKCFDGKSYPLDESLTQLQKTLNPEQFIRLNRQLLVHINAIKKLIAFKPGQLEVFLAPEYHENIQLSHDRSRWLKQVLENE